MSLHANDVCLLEVEDYNLYEEEASDHAFSRDKHLPPGKTMEAEKRIRREIANSNERRRMQSINAGFQALRTLLPRHEGEKLSKMLFSWIIKNRWQGKPKLPKLLDFCLKCGEWEKAAILQQTAEYIYNLEQEKTRLLSQNCQLKRLLNQHEGGEIPLKKRKNEIITHVPSIPDSTEDTTVTQSPEPTPVALISLTSKKDIESAELREQLDKERRVRRHLEERIQTLETQVYPITGCDLSRPVVHFEQPEEAVCKLEEEEVVEVPPSTVEAAPVVVAPLLEAAIKAEPRVEVEVLPEAAAEGPSRLYLASTSRQNLETIVEAIRHLEGDHLFREEGADAPLALTKKVPRPGVIVVKHS